MREKVENEWLQFKLFPSEVLDVYKERFDIMITKLTCVGVKKPELELATAFIRKLDDVRLWR